MSTIKQRVETVLEQQLGEDYHRKSLPKTLSEDTISKTLSNKSVHTIIANEGSAGISENSKTIIEQGLKYNTLDKEEKSFIQSEYPYNDMKKSNPIHPIPLQDRILITKTKPEEKTTGGIIIPETAIEDDHTGIVVAIGPTVGSGLSQATCPGIGYSPKPGNLVQFGQYAGTEVEYKGVKYLIMRESDILCILP